MQLLFTGFLSVCVWWVGDSEDENHNSRTPARLSLLRRLRERLEGDLDGRAEGVDVSERGRWER